SLFKHVLLGRQLFLKCLALTLKRRSISFDGRCQRCLSLFDFSQVSLTFGGQVSLNLREGLTMDFRVPLQLSLFASLPIAPFGFRSIECGALRFNIGHGLSTNSTTFDFQITTDLPHQRLMLFPQSLRLREKIISLDFDKLLCVPQRDPIDIQLLCQLFGQTLPSNFQLLMAARDFVLTDLQIGQQSVCIGQPCGELNFTTFQSGVAILTVFLKLLLSQPQLPLLLIKRRQLIRNVAFASTLLGHPLSQIPRDLTGLHQKLTVVIGHARNPPDWTRPV
ncbi:MAG: hypothetical protein ACI8P0_003600, partial [Planctomycetaceae bacterium]